MADMKAIKQWHHSLPDGSEYLVSTDPSLVDRAWVNAAFATDEMYWAKPLDAAHMEAMLSNSLNLVVYRLGEERIPSSIENGIPVAKSVDEPSSPRTPSPTLEDTTAKDGNTPLAPQESAQQRSRTQVAYGRIVTDFVTFAYFSDVYVEPAQRKRGFANLLMRCCREVLESMPALRRAYLVANANSGAVQFYETSLGFRDWNGEMEGKAVMMTRKFRV